MWHLTGTARPPRRLSKTANWQNPAEQCVALITQAVGVEGVGVFNADAVATKLMGDSIFINPMILGYAWQKGWVPLAAGFAHAGDGAEQCGD